MPSSTVHPFKYRTGDKQVHTFYAPDRTTADRYARRWAIRLGHSRIVRLKPTTPKLTGRS